MNNEECADCRCRGVNLIILHIRNRGVNLRGLSDLTYREFGCKDMRSLGIWVYATPCECVHGFSNLPYASSVRMCATVKDNKKSRGDIFWDAPLLFAAKCK